MAVFRVLIALTHAGLRHRGLTDTRIDDLLAPVERRWTIQMTPSMWKRNRVTARLDAGDNLAAAFTGMQREYIHRVGTEEPFPDWIE